MAHNLALIGSVALTCGVFFLPVAQAAEGEGVERGATRHEHGGTTQPKAGHGDHGAGKKSPKGGYVAAAKGGLTQLPSIPPSGKAREAGFDGHHHIEPTSDGADLATLCAQGTRGLIMLDNATWAKCGGKPKGASKGPGYYPAIPPWNTPGLGEVRPHTGHGGH
jgi:hypothetical protein